MRRSSLASTSMTALRLPSSVSTRRSQRPALGVAQEAGDDRAVERHQALRDRRGDRGQGEADQPGDERPARPAVAPAIPATAGRPDVAYQTGTDEERERGRPQHDR